MSPEVLYVIAGVLIVVGLVGTVLPALPGVPLVFAGMVVAAWAGDFKEIGWFTITLLAILTALALIADFVATALGTKVAGASGWAFAGAAIGAIVGIFFGLVGLLLGPFIGAVLGELIAGGTMRKATTAGLGAWVGLICGTLAKIALAFTMLGVFVWALVW